MIFEETNGVSNMIFHVRSSRDDKTSGKIKSVEKTKILGRCELGQFSQELTI